MEVSTSQISRPHSSLIARLKGEIAIINSLLFRKISGDTQSERLESFYRNQANHYDTFRKRLLPGREQLIKKALSLTKDRRLWVDLACGTGISLEYAGDIAKQFDKIILVDLSESLLEVARIRVSDLGLKNVEVVNMDLCSDPLGFGDCSVVTCMYGLTMIPEWYNVIDKINKALSDQGIIAIIDFYVSKKHAALPSRKHGIFTRELVPLWFQFDDVFLSPDHLPYLKSRFSPIEITENLTTLPYLNFIKVPWYSLIAQKLPG